MLKTKEPSCCVGVPQETEELLSGLDAVLVPARNSGNQNGMGNVAGIPQVVFPVGFEPLVPKKVRKTPRKDPKAQVRMQFLILRDFIFIFLNG